MKPQGEQAENFTCCKQIDSNPINNYLEASKEKSGWS